MSTVLLVYKLDRISTFWYTCYTKRLSAQETRNTDKQLYATNVRTLKRPFAWHTVDRFFFRVHCSLIYLSLLVDFIYIAQFFNGMSLQLARSRYRNGRKSNTRATANDRYTQRTKEYEEKKKKHCATAYTIYIDSVFEPHTISRKKRKCRRLWVHVQTHR